MKWNPITRRHFLEGVGKTALMLPLLPSLLAKEMLAMAAPAAGQKNFIGICGFNGMFRMFGPTSELMPPTNMTGTGLSGYGFVDLPGKHRVHHKLLVDIKNANGGAVSNLVDASFNPYLGKMLMMQGFDYLSLGWFHHAGQFGNFNAAAGGASGNPGMAGIDQVLAHSSNFYKNASLLKKSVAYTVKSGEMTSGPGCYGASFTYKDPTDKLNSAIVGNSAYYDPVTLWNNFFGSKTATTPLKVTLVDQTLKDYQALRSSPRLGSEDRFKLDQHIALLYETQTRIQTIAGVCTNTKPTNITDPQTLLRAMNDVIVSIIACGLCHTFLGWGHAVISPQDSESWHRWSHEAYSGDTDTIATQTSYDNVVAQNRVVMKIMVLDLAAKLDALGLLDQSLIALIHEHGKKGHQTWNVPIITMGSAGGVLNTGQYIDYRNAATGDDLVTSRQGFPINQALANFLQAVGMPPSEYEALNKPAFANPMFAPNSGYSTSRFHPDVAGMFGYNYTSGWQGHNLSDWLPLIKV